MIMGAKTSVSVNGKLRPDSCSQLKEDVISISKK